MDAVSAAFEEELHAFRAAHPLRSAESGSQAWLYADTGSSGPAVVLLPGLGASAEVMFPIVLRLAKSSRVISLGYPRGVRTVDAALAGVDAVLRAASVSSATFVGHSQGAALALSLARRSPERVKALALANFGIYLRLRARLLARTLRLVSNLPEAVRARLMVANLRRLVPAQAGKAFWSAYFAEAVAAQSAVFGDQLDLLGDLLRQPPFRRDELGRWEKASLILESEEDSGFEPQEQSALRELLPKATVHVFPGAGHLSWVEQPDVFASEVRDLLE